MRTMKLYPLLLVFLSVGCQLGSSCEDKYAGCEPWVAAMNGCEGIKWIQKNCKKSCNTCPESTCKDKYPGQCPGWKSDCTDDYWQEWMEKHCPKTCNVCPDTTVITTEPTVITTEPTVITTEPTVTTTTASACNDTYEEECPGWISDCTEGEWKEWMLRNCKKTCNVCEDTTVITTEPTVTTTTTTTTTEAPPKGECGKENKPMTRIQGGSETAPNQFPWMVRLPMGCGGSFITDRHILTAKHCVEAHGVNWRGRMVKYSVHNQYDEKDYKEVAIKDFVMPQIAESHDIAIIILEKAVDLSEKTVGTVCLPTSADEVYTGKQALAMGWGWNPVPQGQSETLFKVGLKVDNEQGVWLTTETVMMNGKPVDVCRGDSGGPLVYNEEGRWIIIGTVQGGEYCDDPNHTGSSGLWNRVTAHLKWINSVIAK